MPRADSASMAERASNSASISLAPRRMSWLWLLVPPRARMRLLTWHTRRGGSRISATGPKGLARTVPVAHTVQSSKGRACAADTLGSHGNAPRRRASSRVRRLRRPVAHVPGARLPGRSSNRAARALRGRARPAGLPTVASPSVVISSARQSRSRSLEYASRLWHSDHGLAWTEECDLRTVPYDDEPPHCRRLVDGHVGPVRLQLSHDEWPSDSRRIRSSPARRPAEHEHHKTNSRHSRTVRKQMSYYHRLHSLRSA